VPRIAARPFDEHFALYQRYQAARHAGGGMDQDSHEQYANFLLQSRVDSRLIEFTETASCAWSASSTSSTTAFVGLHLLRPGHPGAGFGTYNILWQIAQCSANNLPYLYLGYWIRESRKMAYKADFRPIEGLIDGVWQELAAR
jgi:arginyl-tRNA--protein-N-Asp/Glu arginylyltransferase